MTSVQIAPFTPYPVQFSRYDSPINLKFSLKTPVQFLPSFSTAAKYQHTHHSNPTNPVQSSPKTKISIQSNPKSKTLQTETSVQPNSRNKTRRQEDGIPTEDIQIIAKFKSRYNYIRVLEVSRKVDHPLAGSRLLLLDDPGNIHSISFSHKLLTNTYFDVFATLPPILPPGPVAILGFGAGSAARLILELYQNGRVHGWELDPSVIAVGRKYFGLERLERDFSDRLFIYIGNALSLESYVRDGFSGILVDLFSKGSVIPELQDPNTWEEFTRCLRKGGRIMVNVGGRCVEAEDKRRDGAVVMQDTLKAMHQVFGDNLFVLSLGSQNDDSTIALTGELPDLDAWKSVVPRSLRFYMDMWTPYSS
ncbi:hypothetical protein JCGZ_11421 [Jatropha curcas]|uniref:PABS domain-containing protein n=1 Tax=Jatropha curcas TaxID=180498 RepID=A0A067KFK5_JATCU|nr:uncharacterized protein LOC105640324 [Jatropha curcas]XP_037493043.1 uncharacterized protein LOC105640324 [Jatropha curcas]KDP31045.1 hypothetical protein JCGZ_11421 [Jatropha curcas]